MAVKVDSFKGRLRFRWSYQRKRYNLSLGFDDTALSRTVAQARASLIDADLVTGNFDPTLAKYQSNCTKEKALNSSLTAVNLFNQFTEYKCGELDPRTLGKYKAIVSKVSALLGSERAAIGTERADQFRLELGRSISPDTQKGYLTRLSACWEWGVKEGLVTENPWRDVLTRVKVPPKQKARPFTKIEMTTILTAFKESKHYGHYGDFVEFMFSTGCRTGEAIGLRWEHLSDDCTKVWIGESASRGIRKPTKTNRSREFRLTPRLSAMLRSRYPEDTQSDDLVFPSPKGLPCTHNSELSSVAARSSLKRAFLAELFILKFSKIVGF